MASKRRRIRIRLLLCANLSCFLKLPHLFCCPTVLSTSPISRNGVDTRFPHRGPVTLHVRWRRRGGTSEHQFGFAFGVVLACLRSLPQLSRRFTHIPAGVLVTRVEAVQRCLMLVHCAAVNFDGGGGDAGTSEHQFGFASTGVGGCCADAVRHGDRKAIAIPKMISGTRPVTNLELDMRPPLIN